MIKKGGKRQLEEEIIKIISRGREGAAEWKHVYTSFVPLPTGGSLIKQLTGPVQPGRSDVRMINNITLLNFIPGEINKPYKQKSPRERLGD